MNDWIKIPKSFYLTLPLLIGWVALIYSQTISEKDLMQKAGFTSPENISAIIFLENRAGLPPTKEDLDTWIRELADSAPNTRQKACQKLVNAGDYSIWHLENLKNNATDSANSKNARECLDLILGNQATRLVEISLRLASQDSQSRAGLAILGYAPYAPNDQILEETSAALKNWAGQSEHAKEILSGAISQSHPRKRAMAGALLIQKKWASDEQILKLLADSSEQVSSMATLALLKQMDKRAIPQALKAFETATPENAKRIEDTLMAIAGEWSVQGPLPTDQLSQKIRQSIWEAWWKNIQSRDLLAPVRLATISPEKTITIRSMVSKMISEGTELTKPSLENLSPAEAGFLLNLANNSKKVESATAKVIGELEKIARKQEVTTALIQLIELSQPEDAANTLIQYASSCPDEETLEQLKSVLNKDPKKTIACERVLKNNNSPESSKAFALELISPESEPFREIQAKIHEKSAVLKIAYAKVMFPKEPYECAKLILETCKELPNLKASWLMNWMAGQIENTTTEINTESPEETVKTIERLGTWFEANKGKIQLIKSSSSRLLNPILLVENMNPEKKSGRVLLLGGKGGVVWEIINLNSPNDAKFNQGRVLISEAGNNRVTERDIRGNILWEKQIQNPFYVQKTSNGNIFIAARNEIVELDSKGKEIFKHSVSGQTILAARKSGPTEYQVLQYSGNLAKINSKGSELSKVIIPFPTNFGLNGATLLADGKILVSIPTINKIMEFSDRGNLLHEYDSTAPGIATRNMDGTILTSNLQANKLVKIRRDGKVLWETAPGKFKPFKAGETP